MSFDKRAGEWDALERRRVLADAVAGAIRDRVPLSGDMRLLDIGAGTGLLSERLADSVASVVAIDSSEGMLERFAEKFSRLGLRADTLCGDFMLCDIPSADIAVSSMTLHHIPDIEAFFSKLFKILSPGGYMAIADLTPEEGTFHDHGNDGVFHFGFDEKVLVKIASSSGFVDVAHEIVHTVSKERGEYDIFLLTGRKPDA